MLSNMAQIGKQINCKIHKVHSYDQMGKMTIHFGSNKGDNN